MSRLEDEFRERLLGHLSDANTEVDVKIAVEVCKLEMLSFISFLRENYAVGNKYGDLYSDINIWREYQTESMYTTEKLLEIYLNKK